MSGLTLSLLSLHQALPLITLVTFSAFLFFDISLSPGLCSIHTYFFLFTCLFLFVFLMLHILHPCPILGLHDVFLLPLTSVSCFPLLLTLSSLVHFLFSIILFFVSDVLSFFHFPLFFSVLYML